MKNTIKYIIMLFACLFMACEQEDDMLGYESSQHSTNTEHIGEPIDFNFKFEGCNASTRATTNLNVSKTVYITPDKGTTFYKYKYNENHGRWECAETDPLKWTDTEMKLWAFVGSSESKNITIEPNQSENGYEDSDFMAAFGNYTYTNGQLEITLNHKVAKLMVTVKGGIDPSILTCSTITPFPTSATISFGDDNISLIPADNNKVTFKLYRTSYQIDATDTGNNETNFVGYFIPDANFSTKFALNCGPTIQYNSNNPLSVPLKAGQTSKISIVLPSINQVTDFDAATTNTGSAQNFTAPITGYYKLEVWGAQGGSYEYWRTGYGWSAYDEQMRGTSVCAGGMGAYVSGKIYLQKGTSLYVYVGKEGVGDKANGTLVSGTTYKMNGGWNGGGTVQMASEAKARTSSIPNTSVEATRPQGGGGGGGATDIAINNSTWDNATHLNSRIIVAAGGGGGCYVPNQKGWYTGGYGGGGSTWAGGDGDGDAASRARGGTLSNTPLNVGAQDGIKKDGGFGYGGWGQWGVESLGAGGGGWYGGAAAGGTNSNGAGAGGSSYAYTQNYNGTDLTGYYPSGVTKPDVKYLLTDVTNLAGNYVETVDEANYSTTTIEGARNSKWGRDGHARITLIITE